MISETEVDNASTENNSNLDDGNSDSSLPMDTTPVEEEKQPSTPSDQPPKKKLQPGLLIKSQKLFKMEILQLTMTILALILSQCLYLLMQQNWTMPKPTFITSFYQRTNLSEPVLFTLKDSHIEPTFNNHWKTLDYSL